MNAPNALHIKLLSDATFGRGEGTAGEVDTEVEHDEYGIPFIGGKTTRSLLRDSWLSMRPHFPALQDAGDRVFGPTKRFLDDDICILRVGDALLEQSVRVWLLSAATRSSDRDRVPPESILATCTDIRYQTAEDRETGAPESVTLRSSRVVLRTFKFEAPLTWKIDPTELDLCVLAMAALATRHGGLMRNRGRGHLRVTLDGGLEETRRLIRLSKENSK